MKLTIILLSVVAAILYRSDNQVLAIKCYVCQSNVDPKCADPFDNLTLPITDCDAYPRSDLVSKTDFDLVEEKSFFLSLNQPAPVKPLRASMCRKTRQKVNGEWRTIRGCGYLGSINDSPEGPENHCQIRHGNHDIFMESCACNSKDGCNHATGIHRDAANWRLLALIAPATLTVSAYLGRFLAKPINLCLDYR